MVAAEDGFLYPELDKENCVQCFACENVCPVLHPIILKDNKTEPDVYACWNRQKNVREASSSGGAFSALAMSVINLGGYVAGASYDEDMSVKHYLCNSLEDLTRLRGSKYVQSDTSLIYKEVKDKLKDGRIVLFVGTPCQVAAIRSFLKKNYENFYCCDFICHGTPSPLLFKKYLHWVEDKKEIKIKHFNFRHKRSGWYDALRVANNDCYMKGDLDAYFYGFNCNVSLRESCYRCPAIGMPRKGDITIADYWGIGMKYKFNRPDEIPNGVSLVMENNEKGAKLFEMAKPYLYWQRGHFDEALSRNQPMVKASCRPQSRDTFYLDMVKLDFDELRNKYLKIKGKARLIAFFRENAPRKLVTGLRKIVQIITWKRNGSKTL